MNLVLLVAGISSVSAALVHGFGGERFILSRVPGDAFPAMPNGSGDQAKAETRMTWHGITGSFLLSGVLLLAMGLDQLGTEVAPFIALQYAVWTVVLAIVPPITLRDPRAALRSPQ